MNLNPYDIALHQFKVAIRLYTEGDFISALALAGASEEVLGKMVKELGIEGVRNAYEAEEHAIQWLMTPDRGIYDPYHIYTEGNKKDINRLLNGPRNSLKHFIKEAISFDPEDEAYGMIDRAVDNIRNLKGESEVPQEYITLERPTEPRS